MEASVATVQKNSWSFFLMRMIEFSVELFLMGYLLVLVKKGLFKATEQQTVVWVSSVCVYSSEGMTS